MVYIYQFIIYTSMILPSVINDLINKKGREKVNIDCKLHVLSSMIDFV